MKKAIAFLSGLLIGIGMMMIVVEVVLWLYDVDRVVKIYREENEIHIRRTYCLSM